MKGCLGFVLLCVLLIISLVVWLAIRETGTAAHSSAISPPTQPRPRPNPSPATEAARPSTSPTQLAAAVSTPPPPPLTAEEARTRLQRADDACLARLKSTAAYRDAARAADDLARKLDDMRRAGEMTGRLETSSTYTKAAKKVKDLEAAALAADTVVAAAGHAYAQARQREATESAAREMQRLSLIREARDRQRAEQERIANDPRNVAIRAHRLVRGMSLGQAVQALGDPNGVSDAGDVKILTWQRDGRAWSATFVGGEAVEVTVLAF